MPGPSAAADAALDGPHVRRLTRQSAARRASVTWWDRVTDAWSTVASAGIGLAVLGGWLASVRDDIAGREPVSTSPLPASMTVAVSAVVAVAALCGLLDRLGPVSASPAAAAWWLPLPADRRRLLRSDLLRVTAVCSLTAGAFLAPVAGVWLDRPAPLTVGAAAVAGAATAAVLVGAVALLQSAGRGGRLATVAGAVALGVSGAAAVLAAVPPLSRAVGRLTAVDLPAAPPAAALGLAAAALLLLVAADRRLGRLGAGPLRVVGETSSYASASVFSMDFRDLGRALARPPRRAPRRPRRFPRVRRPEQAVAAADLLLLLRSPWQLGQLVAAIAIAVLAVRTEGLDRLPAAGAAGLALSWLAAAVAAGHPARHAQAAPALDRLLPLSPGRLVAARCAAPVLVLTVVCGCGGLLIAQGSGHMAAWTLLALGTVPTWTAAALRGAYRPDLDWAGPVISTPMGIVPAGAGATLVQGADVGLLGCLPAIVALLVVGSPSPTLVAAQWVWAAALAAAALIALARRRPASAE